MRTWANRRAAQMGALNYGIPTRMARAMYKLFQRDGQEAHERKIDVIDQLLSDDQRIPLADEMGDPTGERAIWNAAEEAARECYEIAHRVHSQDAIKIVIGMICRRRGVQIPAGETFAEIFARAIDKAWWRRVLRTEFKRRFEHTAIQLGLTYVRTGDPYVSRETALMQEAQNRANLALLEQRTATNEHGQSFTVAELAALGVGNKTIRRGELMLRIRGFEEVADTLRDVGLFWTITCPSKFHSVGGTNPRYNGATPRDAQAYLCDVWKRIRAALHRAGIRPYGFRIAEPHSDGCPHWHMLLFVDREHVEAMSKIVHDYALQEDGDEPGAQANRVKLVRIEAGKGTAAGYIAKYVSKNIDGAGVGDHKTFENGQTYIVAPDMFGELEITPSQRVTYWSQVWGIRQFQQIGGAPIGVWRELRRVRAETVANAPEAIKAAHAACQKIESTDPAVAKQADFAAYLMAQGGPRIARKHLAVLVEHQVVTINGRYATYEDKKPVGVYAAAQPDALYESVRYRWTIDGPGRSAGAVFGVPRTGVNNCTRMNTMTGKPLGSDQWFDAAPGGKSEKNFVRDPWDATENPKWSRERDRATAARFKQRSARYAGSHLQHLKRKYGEGPTV